jgi:hypothetical protein
VLPVGFPGVCAFGAGLRLPTARVCSGLAPLTDRDQPPSCRFTASASWIAAMCLKRPSMT